jgi:hypothetical protein
MDFGVFFLLLFFVVVIVFWDVSVMPARYWEREESRRIRDYLRRRQNLIQAEEDERE